MPNSNYSHLIAALFFMLFLTGCAGVTRVPLDKDATAGVQNIDSKLLITADEIIVRAQPSNISLAMGGGLIPALIDASVTKSRQTALEAIATPFYEKADDIDFRTVFSDSFKAVMANQKALPPMHISVSTRGLSFTALDEKRAQLAAEEAYFGLRIRYEFTPDLRSIIVTADTMLIAKPKQEPLYKNSFLYISDAVDAADPLSAWAENNGKALSETFAKGATEIAHMLLHDLSSPPNEQLFASMEQQPKIKTTIPFFMPIPVNGFLVEEKDKRQIIRGQNGALYSVAKIN